MIKAVIKVMEEFGASEFSTVDGVLSLFPVYRRSGPTLVSTSIHVATMAFNHNIRAFSKGRPLGTTVVRGFRG